MAEESTLQAELVRFGRVIALLFNRATMYQMSHPYVKQTIDEFCLTIEQILKRISPLVFILNRDQFSIDEVPFDPRTNVSRIVAHFKKAEIQSISFDSGLGKNELKSFLEVFTSLDTYPNADAMKKALVVKGVKHMKINHVFYKKVTQDDEVVSRDALRMLAPEISEEDQHKSKRLFVDMVLGSLLEEELREAITLENLLQNPSGLTKKMTEADLNSSRSGVVEGGRPGLVLLHQIEVLGDEVGKNLLEGREANLPEIATALFEVKRRLIESIEDQRSQDIHYPNEETILDKVNEITDNVVLQVIKGEYKAGEIETSRLAQIVRRLVPEPVELRRLLPKIRSMLMGEGMSVSDYFYFVQGIGKELQSEELAGILQESSEEIGIDGEVLLEEIKKNPVQAAELIFLASEIRKGGGDEQALTDLLVDYVERLGSELTAGIKEENQVEGDQHLRKIITSIESGIVERLKSMDVGCDMLERLEERFSNRIDDILEKVKLEWLHSHSDKPATEARRDLSVLDLFEQSVGENDQLGEILEIVRARVRSGEMDENDFGRIYAEITKQHAQLEEAIKNKMPEGVLKAPVLTFFIEKEIARAERYGLPFSALAFSLVRVVSKKSVGASAKISYGEVMAAIFQRISTVVRDADILGELGKNRLAVLLPMTSGSNAQLALRRYLKLLHGSPVSVGGIPLTIRLAGVATSFDSAHTRGADAFSKTLMSELAQMEKRIKNIQAYF